MSGTGVLTGSGHLYSVAGFEWQMSLSVPFLSGTTVSEQGVFLMRSRDNVGVVDVYDENFNKLSETVLAGVPVSVFTDNRRVIGVTQKDGRPKFSLVNP